MRKKKNQKIEKKNPFSMDNVLQEHGHVSLVFLKINLHKKTHMY